MADGSVNPNQGLEIIKKRISVRENILFKSVNSLTSQGYRQAAVLVPFVSVDQGLAICLTERSQHVDHHKGQISFPGGMVEKSDRSPEDTALRETFEEIGVPTSDIEIIGQIDAVYSITGYLIFPIVADIKSLSCMKINSQEVKEVFFLPVKWILDINNRHLEDFIDKNGACRQVWFFSEYHGKMIWGITASILVQLIHLIEK